MRSPGSCIPKAPNLRVVAADTPGRSPVHFAGLRASNGTGFLFDVVPARASAVSACWPTSPIGTGSRSTMWGSVPAETIPMPCSASVAASVRAFSTTRGP